MSIQKQFRIDEISSLNPQTKMSQSVSQSVSLLLTTKEKHKQLASV